MYINPVTNTRARKYHSSSHLQSTIRAPVISNFTMKLLKTIASLAAIPYLVSATAQFNV
jgi:hypothetical protein